MAKGNMGSNSIDRLSELPDSILSQILSLLPTTKDAVKTSILSGRWISLWAHAPTLHFDYQNPDVINRVLMLHQVRSVDSFGISLSLDDEKHCSKYQMETWILAAIVRNVKQLDLNFLYKRILPRRLLTCETLVDLSLHGCGVIPVNAPVCLPRLKKLLLGTVLYEADESLPNLVSGCPMLEDLAIEFMYGDKSLVCCNVSSPTVKRLAVFYDSVRFRSKLVINTPALEYLEIDDVLAEDVQCGALTSLSTAHISLDNVNYSASILGFVDRLSNVKFTTLCFSNPIKIVDSLLSTWIMSFHNLVQLDLTADCRFLFKLLENAHTLEILIFKEVCEEIKEWNEPNKVPTCLLSRVRVIRLVHTVCTKHELEIVRYLLRNAQVLQMMEIIYPKSFDSEEKRVLQEISQFERGSSSCELSFLDACPN